MWSLVNCVGRSRRSIWWRVKWEICQGGLFDANINPRALTCNHTTIRHSNKYSNIHSSNKVQVVEFNYEAIFLILEVIPSTTTKSYKARKCIWWILMQGFLEKYIFFKMVLWKINSQCFNLL